VTSPTPPAGQPHPITGEPFASPVPPGTGWPEDPAAPGTPVARTAADVVRLAGEAWSDPADLGELEARQSVCRACPRLVAWRFRNRWIAIGRWMRVGIRFRYSGEGEQDRLRTMRS
jgi:hypothetical protein